VSYSLIRAEGTEQTSATALDAGRAVFLMRRWAQIYPEQYLVLHDEQGRAVAFRRPPHLSRPSGVSTSTPPRLHA
jgi:hypothetical protein